MLAVQWRPFYLGLNELNQVDVHTSGDNWGQYGILEYGYVISSTVLYEMWLLIRAITPTAVKYACQWQTIIWKVLLCGCVWYFNFLWNIIGQETLSIIPQNDDTWPPRRYFGYTSIPKAKCMTGFRILVSHLWFYKPAITKISGTYIICNNVIALRLTSHSY